MSLHLARRLPSRWFGRLGSAAGCKQGQASSVRGMANQGNDPWLTATPRVCLHDVPTTLRAGGLPPHAPVTLSANLTDENGREFCSCAHYVTDETGDVDVRRGAAVGGSYTGVFPAGLLTTLAPASHEAPFIRLYRRNSSLPWKIKVSVLDGHQPNGSKTKMLTEVELERHLMAPGVRRRPVREGRVRGALYLPPGDGPFPGVIDMFGSVGGLLEFRSAMLASRGFASLALATFAYDDLPATTDHMDLDYFEEAVELLLAVPQVIPDRCGTVAVSKNGDVALSMATLMNAVKAVVGINTCIMAHGSRLTYKGELYREDNTPFDKGLMRTERGTYARCMQSHFTVDNPAMIPVEEADEDTHFLMVAGEADSWGFGGALAPFRERMLRHNKHNFELVLYPGTGHLIEPPYGPHISQSFHRYITMNDEGESSIRKIPMDWGGQPQPACAAQEDLWFRMCTFLMNHVREESPWFQQHVARQAPQNTTL
ncbi:acyl-coenzyme A thioesterase 1-like isoform X2 [Eriocheir sinensis]|uniref:acyl-coenzyme A thioesterase 1-like isoform X2 n=1 Tax=Eriocheir sinensis TaxID=95602 RepID=UPI0021C5FA78|nr:acyl-coenzyme A thioesterase 1-like isoform X2 [Eriocheir sinensis]